MNNGGEGGGGDNSDGGTSSISGRGKGGDGVLVSGSDRYGSGCGGVGEGARQDHSMTSARAAWASKAGQVGLLKLARIRVNLPNCLKQAVITSSASLL